MRGHALEMAVNCFLVELRIGKYPIVHQHDIDNNYIEFLQRDNTERIKKADV